MTQEQPHIDDDGQDGAQTPPADTAQGLLDTSVADLLSAGLTPSQDAGAGADDDEEEALAEAAAAATAAGQGGAAEAGQGDKPAAPGQAVPPPDAKFADYVSMLAVAPSRASEVPEKVRQAALTAAGTLRSQIVAQRDAEILQSFEAINAQNAATQQRIAPFLELAESDDQEAIAELEQQDPEGARLYHEHIAAGHAARVPKPDVPAEIADLQGSAKEVFRRLTTDEARARIGANYQAGKYPTTKAGLDALRADVEAELVPQTRRSPQARAAAATARAALPRVDASPGAPATPGRESRKDLLDKSVGDLLAEGLAQGAA